MWAHKKYNRGDGKEQMNQFQNDGKDNDKMMING